MTPAMRQYHEIKRQVSDAILFFRMGDFYEMFYEDAMTASRALELTLTSRQKDRSGVAIPMCGIPYHAADTYIGRLIRRGFKVAVCDQVEDPRHAKGIVKREVVRIVTPSTYVHQGYLEEKEANYLMAVIAPAQDGGRVSRGSLHRRLPHVRIRGRQTLGGARAQLGDLPPARDRPT